MLFAVMSSIFWWACRPEIAVNSERSMVTPSRETAWGVGGLVGGRAVMRVGSGGTRLPDTDDVGERDGDGADLQGGARTREFGRGDHAVLAKPVAVEVGDLLADQVGGGLRLLGV